MKFSGSYKALVGEASLMPDKQSPVQSDLLIDKEASGQFAH